MARIRTVRPEFFKNDALASLGPYAMLLFEGLWCYADKEGRLEDRPKRLKAEILPYFEVDADEVLNALDAGGFIKRYEVDGERYIWVIKFTEHQRITGKEAEAQSRIPQYPQGQQQGNVGETTETTGRERKGKEGNGAPPKPPRGSKDFPSITPSLPAEWAVVEATWAAYQLHRHKTPSASPYQDAGCQRLAAMLLAENYTPDKFIRLVDHCLASGWKGIPVGVLKEFENKGREMPTTLSGAVEKMLEESEF